MVLRIASEANKAKQRIKARKMIEKEKKKK